MSLADGAVTEEAEKLPKTEVFGGFEFILFPEKLFGFSIFRPEISGLLLAGCFLGFPESLLPLSLLSSSNVGLSFVNCEAATRFIRYRERKERDATDFFFSL